MPYIKNRQLYICPSTTLDVNSYAIPRQLAQGSGGCTGRLLAEIVVPAEHVFFGDGIGTRGYCGTNRSTLCQGRWGIGRGGPGGDTPSHVEAYQRHNGGGNLAFCDGHAKWLRTPEGPIDATLCRRMFGDPRNP
ncbi:MAG: H-X9-DG-CTERM domain-containing protein [Candidatus Zipacnadales bacterium]